MGILSSPIGHFATPKGGCFARKEIAMPKLKTSKGVKKRFKLTKKGKLKRAKAFKGHILSKKTKKRKRSLQEYDP